MQATFDRLEREGKIGPMENVSADKSRPILQPRKDYRSEYPKLVVVGHNGPKLIKKRVMNSHEELMLKTVAVQAPTLADVERVQMQQELASLRAANAALELKLQNNNTNTLTGETIGEKANGITAGNLDDILPTPGKKTASALEDFKKSLDEPKVKAG